MTYDEQLMAALDALRNREELALPEFAELARHLEQHPEEASQVDRALEFDRRVSSALHEVPVPAGLAEQVLARLATANFGSPANFESLGPSPLAGVIGGTLDRAIDEAGAPIVAESVVAAAVDRSAAAPTSERPWSRLQLSRRSLSILAGIAALAAVLLWGVWPTGELDRDGIALEANSAFTDLAELNADGRPLGNADRAAGFPYSEQLKRFAEVRWQPIERFVGRRGVAFQLRSPAGVLGTLFVVKLQGVVRAPAINAASLPHRPTIYNAGSGGLTTAMWQEHGHLFVLVVDGDARAFREFLPTAQAVTFYLPEANQLALATRRAAA